MATSGANELVAGKECLIFVKNGPYKGVWEGVVRTVGRHCNSTATLSEIYRADNNKRISAYAGKELPCNYEVFLFTADIKYQLNSFLAPKKIADTTLGSSLRPNME